MPHRIDKTESANGTLESSSESPRPESQEFATARFLIDHGFLREQWAWSAHIRTGHELGRTLGSVWQAMHLLLESRPILTRLPRSVRTGPLSRAISRGQYQPPCSIGLAADAQ